MSWTMPILAASVCLIAGCADDSSSLQNPQVVETDNSPPRWDAEPSITVDNVGSTYASLRWTPAQDDRGVAHYQVSLGRAGLREATGSSLLLTGLHPGTDYSATIRAVDRAGNRSSRTLEAKFQTTSSCAVVMPIPMPRRAR